MEQVLQSPELLTLIFDMINQSDIKLLVRHKSSLAPLARVNSRWRDLVCPILWAAPDVEALAKIKSKRRQQYASHIRTLDFSARGVCADPTLHTLFANLQFLKIRELVLGHTDPELDVLDPKRHRPLVIHKDRIVSTSQYLQETLEVLELLSWDSICTRDFFVQIAKRCPRLKRVVFSAIGTQLRPNDLLDFFRASGHLQGIKLRLGPESKSALITDDLLLHFSSMARLEHLEIDNKLNQPDLFRAIKRRNMNPFQNLRRLEMSATSTVVSAAVHVLSKVEWLCLNISDGSCFKDLSTMSSLRSLTIYVTTTATFAREQLLALRALHKLEFFEMRKGHGELYTPEASDFTDADFDLMTSGWPELKTLLFEVMWQQTDSFQTPSSFSEHCPNLERLSLTRPYDLQALSDIPTLVFPRLRILHLETCSVGEAPARFTPLQIARLIDYHAPVLESLNIVYIEEEEDFGVEGGLIEMAWNKLRA